MEGRLKNDFQTAFCINTNLKQALHPLPKTAWCILQSSRYCVTHFYNAIPTIKRQIMAVKIRRTLHILILILPRPPIVYSCNLIKNQIPQLFIFALSVLSIAAICLIPFYRLIRLLSSTLFLALMAILSSSPLTNPYLNWPAATVIQ